MTPPFQEDIERFSYLNYWLGELLLSKKIDEPRYREVANALGARTARLIPKAWLQVKEMMNRFPDRPGSLEDQGRYSATLNKTLPRYTRYLAKQGRLKEAIEICQLCLDHNIDDGTWDGFRKRLDTLKRKEKKLLLTGQPPERGRGKVSPQQIAEIIARYKGATSEERKRIAADYGLTMSHLYYIISKS